MDDPGAAEFGSRSWSGEMNSDFTWLVDAAGACESADAGSLVT